MINFGEVPAGAVLPIPFAAYAAATGASVTLTGLAVTDIEVYKGVSMTQRSSDAGYALMDTDGIDIDGITGIHGFSIDTGDNTDASFYSVGSYFTVVVSAVTIDGQTVNFIAATFRLRAAEASAGVPSVNATQISGDSTAADNLETAFDDTAGPVPWLGIVDQGTAQSATSTTLVLRSAAAFGDDTLVGCTLFAFGSTQGYWQSREITDFVGSTDTATVDAWTVTPSGTVTYKIIGAPPASSGNPVPVNLVQISGDATAADNAEAFFDGTGYAGTNNTIPTVTTVGTVNALAANSLTAAAAASDLGTEIGTAVWATAARTLTALDEDSTTLDLDATIRAAVGLASANLDTQIAAVQSDTNDIQTRLPAALVSGRIDASVGAMAANVMTAAAAAADLTTELQSGLATAAELAKVPKSDGTSTWNATALASLQAEATDALNAYDPPTRAELTTDTNSVLTAVADLPTNAELATALAAADDAVLAAIAALNNLSAAQVNAEVVDALATDTYAEPGQGAPAATASLAAKINYLFKAWRNRKEQTATGFALYNDAGSAVDQKATVGDDGTTTSVGEIVSGP
jgi:hypothetical protein